MKKLLITLLLVLPFAVSAQHGYRIYNQYYDYPSYRAFQFSRDRMDSYQIQRQRYDATLRDEQYKLWNNRGPDAFDMQMMFGDGFGDNGWCDY